MTPVTRSPNMQHIADAVGLSKSSVSLALRNDCRIPEATRLRVQVVAEKMGYRRNPVVDSLMTQLRLGRQPSFQSNLGLVNCSAEKDLSKNHTFRRLREGVFRRADQMGYGIEEYWLDEPNIKPHRLKQILDTRGIRGLILIAATSVDVFHEDYKVFWNDFACAVLGVTEVDNRFDCATNDQYLTARRVTEKVFELGYRRPVLVVPSKDDRLLDFKFSTGFYSVFIEQGSSSFPPVIPFDVANPSAAIEAIRAAKPDVVVTNKTELYDALQADGFSIPKNLGLVHLDWHVGIPHLAGMRQNNRVVGSAGVDLVAGQLQKNEFGPHEFPKVVQIESAWVDGSSVRAVTKRKTGRKTAKKAARKGTKKR